MSLRQFLDQFAPRQPVWKRRRALQEVERLVKDDPVGALAHVAAARGIEPESYLGADLRKAGERLAIAALRAKQAPPHASAQLTPLARRRAIIAELNDATIVDVTEALLPIETPQGDLRQSWLSVLLPRYVSVAGSSRALELAHAAHKGAVYGLIGDPALLERLLDEPAAVIAGAGALLEADEARTLAALATRPPETVSEVAAAFEYDDNAMFVRVALLAAERGLALGGLYLTAAQTAWLDGDYDVARALQARLANESMPLVWRERELDESDVAELEESIANGPVEPTDRARLPDGRSLVEDEAHRWWIANEDGEFEPFGAKARARRSLGAATEIRNLGTSVMLGSSGLAYLISSAAVLPALIAVEAGAALPGEPLTPEVAATWTFVTKDDAMTAKARLSDGKLYIETSLSDDATETSTQKVQSNAGVDELRQWLSDELSSGKTISLQHAEAGAQKLGTWLEELRAAEWTKIPPALERMGFPPDAITVSAAPVAERDFAALATEAHEDALDRLWRTAGAPTLSVGTFTLRFLQPAEVASAAAISVEDAPFKPVAVDAHGTPRLLLALDDGSLWNEDEDDALDDRRRFAIRRGKQWDTGWMLWTALRELTQRPFRSRLSALIGGRRYDEVALDARVKLLALKPVQRRTSGAEAWKALKTWLSRHETDVRLRRGAKASALGAFTKKFPWAPKDLIASLKLHDGDDESGCFGGWSLLDAASITDEYEEHRGIEMDGDPPDDAPELARTWWHERWLPFASSGGGDFLVVDASPDGKGRVFVDLNDPPFRRVLAPSLGAWLIDYVHALESGRIEYDGDWNGFDEFIQIA